jgi:hypothetical protein
MPSSSKDKSKEGRRLVPSLSQLEVQVRSEILKEEEEERKFSMQEELKSVLYS